MKTALRAGTSFAFLGAVLFAVGGIVSPLVGIGDICRPTAIVLLASGAIAAALMGMIHYRPYYLRARRRS